MKKKKERMKEHHVRSVEEERSVRVTLKKLSPI